MTIEEQRDEVRRRRATGETVASLARETALPRRLIRAWTNDVPVPKPERHPRWRQ